MSSLSKPVKAFAPGNISCVFVIKKNKNQEKSGSLGVGFTINKGVIVSLKKFNGKKNIICFNNKKISFPTVDSTIKKITNNKFSVNIESELPLGAGFGLSGASSLAVAYALNKLLKLKKSKKELAIIAHVAEIENMTGLGDIVNQFYGGFLVKYKPSYMFKVKKLPIKNKAIYYKYFSKLDTRKILSNKSIRNKINKAGLASLKKIKQSNKKNINLKNLINISRDFSINSKLLKNKKVIETIKKIENNDGSASMIILGNAVFSNNYFKGSKKLIIEDKGAYVL